VGPIFIFNIFFPGKQVSFWGPLKARFILRHRAGTGVARAANLAPRPSGSREQAHILMLARLGNFVKPKDESQKIKNFS
jgi:hypothetical protein